MAEQMVSKKTNNNEVAITSQNQLAIVQQWTNALTELTNVQQVSLTQAEKEFGVSIITNLTDRCIKSSIKTTDLNMTNFLEQVKHNAKLQLSIAEGELFLDIRNNKDTGLKDVKISRQYQGIQKLLRRHCTKKVIRFVDGIVGEGDTFKVGTDFDTGVTKIYEHTVNEISNQSNLYKIEKAYAIAYVEEMGHIVPYTCIVEKKRILRAKTAAMTDKVWLSDTQAMVKKTAYWCLWAMMKPYIDLPVALQESVVATEDEMNWDNVTPIEFNTNAIYDITPETSNEESSTEELDSEKIKTNIKEEKNSDEVELHNGKVVLTVDYGEYKNNKEKYEKISYDKGTYTAKVILKDIVETEQE